MVRCGNTFIQTTEGRFFYTLQEAEVVFRKIQDRLTKELESLDKDDSPNKIRDYKYKLETLQVVVKVLH
jgi:hypothetical protein